MIAYLRVYDVKDGQRFYLDMPVSEQSLAEEWAPHVREVVREQIEAVLRNHGLGASLIDPVVLCWRKPAFGAETESEQRPYVWDAWAVPYRDPPPLYASLPDARLLVIERARAVAAADTWPREAWYWLWHPTAAARFVARERGITAVLYDADGREVRRFRFDSRHPMIEMPELRGVLFRRDPEPLGLADDGTALWGYRRRTYMQEAV